MVPLQSWELLSIMVNNGKFDGLTTDQANAEVARKLEEINRGGPRITYKLRDWVFSRQRYWGEPIPIYFPVDFPEGVTPAT
jgi:leucyl-tRNA synthetase